MSKDRGYQKRQTVNVPVVKIADEDLDRIGRAIRGEPETYETLTAGAMDARIIKSRPYFQEVLSKGDNVTGEVIVAPPQANSRVFLGDVYQSTAQAAGSASYGDFVAYGDNVEGGERLVFRHYPNEDYAEVVRGYIFALGDGEGLKYKVPNAWKPLTLFVQWWRFPTRTPGIIDIGTSEIKDLASA